MDALVQQLMQMLLTGDDPVLAILRDQYQKISRMGTELSGVGFFIHYERPEDAPRIPGDPSFTFGDVNGEVDGLEHGAGFVLFVEDGALSMFEGYSYDEPWPQEVKRFALRYSDGPHRDLSALRASPGWP